MNYSPPSGNEVRISKLVIWRGALGLLVVLAGVLFWQLGGVPFLRRLITPATLELVVIDSGGKAVPEAIVTLNGQDHIIGASGRLTLGRLYRGRHRLSLNASGYRPASETIDLKRGYNRREFKLARTVEKVKVTLVVKDFVTDQPLEGVAVVSSLGKSVTNAQGEVALADVPVGDLAVTADKSGFNQKSETVKITKPASQPLALTPSGRAVFVSNREGGKRGIYTANYDGSEVKPLIARHDETEDFNALGSPDGKKVAFFSTRERRRSEGSTGYEPSLYLVDSDGKNLAQLSREFALSNLRWSPDGGGLAWTSRSESTSNTNHLYLYTLTTKQTTKLSEEKGSSYLFEFNHAGTAIAWTQTAESDPSAPAGVYWRDLKKKETKRIEERSVGSAAFSDDDGAIIYTYSDNTIEGGGKTKAVKYSLSDGTKNETEIPQRLGVDKIFSPDRRQVAYIDERDGRDDLFISDPSGANEKRLTTLGTATEVPVWDKTGRYLLFDSEKPAETAKYIVGLTGQPKKISDILLEFHGHQDF